MSADHPYIIDVSLENFSASVIEPSRDVPVLVDFWAPWCGPCQSLMPMLSQLAEAYAGAFVLAKVNIDEQQELAMQFAVRSVPTVKLVRNGEVVDEFLGALPEGQIRAFIERYIVRESDRQLPLILEAFAQNRQQEALVQLRQLRQQEPDNLQLILCEADFLQQMQRLDEARALLYGLPANLATDPEVQTAMSRLQLAIASLGVPDEETLQQRLAQAPDDHLARYQLASSLSGQGRYEEALEQFLELLRRAPDFQEDAARKGMLMVFDLLGGQGELVSRFRRQMFTALH